MTTVLNTLFPFLTITTPCSQLPAAVLRGGENGLAGFNGVNPFLVLTDVSSANLRT